MKTLCMTGAVLGAVMIGTGAMAAQTTAPMTPTSTATQTTAPSAMPSPSATQPATTPTAPLTSADVNDGEVGQFATAVVAVNKIQQDASVADADKQTKMAAAVTGSGLTPHRFNEIAQASQADPALMTRIQAAAAKQMKAAPAAK